MPVTGCAALAEVTIQLRVGLFGSSTQELVVMSGGESVQTSQCPRFNNSCSSPNLIISLEKQISNCGKETEIF